MIAALIDNGSLEPAAHLNLRRVAAELSRRTGIAVQAVSWKHSDRVPASDLHGRPAWTLAPWVREQLARGERDFVFVPFFISAQGAIGSALRRDLEVIRRETGDFDYTFTTGLAHHGAIAGLIADRIRETIVARNLSRPPVVLVDHGGPSSASAALRDSVAEETRRQLGDAIERLTAASMEGAHPPLLAEQLRASGFADRDVVVALLFLSSGRHAGADGDVARICTATPAHCHLTTPIGDHPRVIEILAEALRAELAGRPDAIAGGVR